MFMVRQAQLDDLRAAALRAFEDRTYAHLQRSFPRHCQLLGEAQLRLVVRRGWDKAQAYDLTPECCVRSYIEFMCRLGSAFDTDPLLPWAARILSDRASFGPIERGDRLYDQAWDYIDAIIADYRDPTGQPNTARLMEIIRPLRHGSDAAVVRDDYPAYRRELADLIAGAFPAKTRYVGERRLEALIARAVRLAWSYGIAGQRGIRLLALLLFVLGNGFTDDPLLPWAAAVLSDQAIIDERGRVDHLYAEGVRFLARWWETAPAPGG